MVKNSLIALYCIVGDFIYMLIESSAGIDTHFFALGLSSKIFIDAQ